MRAAVFVACLSLACGPEEADDVSESSGAPPTSSGSTSSSAEASTVETTTTSDDATTSGVGTTTSGGATGSSGNDDSGAQGVIYRAVALPTGVPRIAILKQNSIAGTCTWVVLAYGTSGALDIATPRGWMTETAGINDVAASCDDYFPAKFGAVGASAGSGAIDFDASMTAIPEELDIDVELTFDESLGGTPLADELVAQDLVVELG